jgi:hypothetical protein
MSAELRQVVNDFSYRVRTFSTTCYKKLVVDMHYEAHIMAIINFHASVLGEKVSKKDARTKSLTRDQYLQVNIEH